MAFRAHLPGLAFTSPDASRLPLAWVAFLERHAGAGPSQKRRRAFGGRAEFKRTLRLPSGQRIELLCCPADTRCDRDHGASEICVDTVCQRPEELASSGDVADYAAVTEETSAA